MSTLGILGGLGPMASVYFYELLTAHTRATCDHDHIDLLISSRASTPDRTAFILGKSPCNPAPVMAQEAERLVRAGADLLAIPCNTAHTFYETVQSATDVPVLNIIRLTAAYCQSLGISRVGVLATEGTVASGAYKTELDKHGIAYRIPDADGQRALMDIIYGQIKRGLVPDVDRFLSVANGLFADGCERVILACTELSLLKRDFLRDPRFIDSMEVLALAAIRRTGKEPVGFDDELMRFQP